MKSATRWMFRILFFLFIIYHIWNYFDSGFDAFMVLKPSLDLHPSLASKVVATILYLGGNMLNYVIQIVLPILFFYFGFLHKDEPPEFNVY